MRQKPEFESAVVSVAALIAGIGFWRAGTLENIK